MAITLCRRATDRFVDIGSRALGCKTASEEQEENMGFHVNLINFNSVYSSIVYLSEGGSMLLCSRDESYSHSLHRLVHNINEPFIFVCLVLEEVRNNRPILWLKNTVETKGAE